MDALRIGREHARAGDDEIRRDTGRGHIGETPGHRMQRCDGEAGKSGHRTLAWRYGPAMVTLRAGPGKRKYYNGTPCLRLRRRTACRRWPRRPARVPSSRRRCGSGLDPNPHRPPVLLVDLERIRLAHEVAQFAEAERSRIEIGREIGKLA